MPNVNPVKMQKRLSGLFFFREAEVADVSDLFKHVILFVSG